MGRLKNFSELKRQAKRRRIFAGLHCGVPAKRGKLFVNIVWCLFFHQKHVSTGWNQDRLSRNDRGTVDGGPHVDFFEQI